MQSKDFIEKYTDVISWYSEHLNETIDKQNWDDFKVHFLICFPSTYQDKSFSQTLSVIYNNLKGKVYFDYAYLPTQNDVKYYDLHNQPYFIGTQSLKDPSQFEFVGFSISVLYEAVSALSCISTFSRVGISPFVKDRSGLPYLFFGGITSPYCFFASPMIDFWYLGSCERMVDMFSMYEGQSKVDYINSILSLGNIYHPASYKVVWKEGFIVENTKVNPVAPDFVSPYYPKVIHDQMHHPILRTDGQGVNVSSIQVSEGCSGGGSCSFCAESHYTSHFVELSQSKVKDLLWSAKSFSASDTFKPFSFNTNYLTDYKQRLLDFLTVFPRVNVSNMRMQELGLDPDSIDISLSVGSPRLQAPIEGYSPRLINSFLNKNLSTSSIHTFFDTVIKNKVMDVKIGLIHTGYEQSQDYQYLFDLVSNYKSQAASIGSNLPIRANVTQLVHYPLTPLEFVERKSALQSMNAVKVPEGEWFKRYESIGFRFNLVTERYQTFVEQCLLDLPVFALLYKHFIQPSVLIRSIRDLLTTSFVHDLKQSFDFSKVFNNRDIDNYISPCHRVYISSFGSYVRRARNLCNVLNDFSGDGDIRCLGTLPSQRVKCYSHDLIHKPFKLYSDCRIVDGCIQGTLFKLLLGCEGCSSKQEIKQTTQHSIQSNSSSQITFNDFLTLSRPQKTHKYRFTLIRTQESLNPDYISHLVLSRFLQSSDILLHSFHSIEGSSNQWMHTPALHTHQTGVQLVDVYFSDGVIDELMKVSQYLSHALHSVTISSIREVPLYDTLTSQLLNLYTFQSLIPYESFSQSFYKYDQTISLPQDPLHAYLWSDVHDDSLTKPVFTQRGSLTIGAFSLSGKYNPLYYLRSYLKSAYRNPVDDVLLQTHFTCRMVLQDSINLSSGSFINKHIPDILQFLVSKLK